jgi:hypothetical protein
MVYGYTHKYPLYFYFPISVVCFTYTSGGEVLSTANGRQSAYLILSGLSQAKPKRNDGELNGVNTTSALLPSQRHGRSLGAA